MTIYAGLDVSDKTTHICVVDSDGAVLRRDVVASDPDVLAKWFERHCPDLGQVVLEMLRHVREGGANKADAAALFGLSRPTYYQAETAFDRDGIAGLLPRTRGPKSAHKLTAEVMRLIEEHLDRNGQMQARALAALVHTRLGISIHPRSIERALARKKKR